MFNDSAKNCMPAKNLISGYGLKYVNLHFFQYYFSNANTSDVKISKEIWLGYESWKMFSDYS